MGLPIYDKGFAQEEIDFGIEKYVEGVREKILIHYKNRLPNLTPCSIRIDEGSKYCKVVRYEPGKDNGTSVHSFIRKVDGAILKAASWKAPALNYARGFVTESDYGLPCANEYGVV
jgi:hypothetical protein